MANNPISSSFFGVNNFEAYRRPAFTQAGNGVILNGVFYPFELKQFTQTSTAGAMGYLITPTAGSALYIRDFWWIYNSGVDTPVVTFSFYDSAAGFKRWWYYTDVINANFFKAQHFDVNMLMPQTMQFTQTFNDNLKLLGYMEVDLYCAVVPAIVQVEGIQQGETNGEKDCLLLDWITDKCNPPRLK